MKNTKEHILKIANSLFLQKSFKEVTMKEIVEKTGMSKGAFYHYFTSKEQLFLEIVESFLSFGRIDYDNFNYESLFEFYHQYLERLNNIFPDLEVWMGNSDNTNININFFMLMFDAINRYPGFRDKAREMHKIEIDSWKKIIGIAREKGEIKSPMIDDQIAKVFTHMTDGLYLHSVLDGRIVTIKSEIKNLFDSLYEELKA